MYKVDSSQAEEFIHHEEILETLEYARNHKDNRTFIEQLIEKAALCKVDASRSSHPAGM